MELNNNNSTAGTSSSRLIWIGLILLAINAMAFTVLATAAYIQQDVWRHLNEIVIPIMDGREQLSALWGNHHPSPLLHILQAINLKYLSLRLDYNAYIGVVFQILITIVIIKTILKNMYSPGEPIGRLGKAFGLLIAFISLGFNCLEQYTWPLLGTVQYLYFFGLLVFLSSNRCAHKESPGNYLLVAVASLVFMFANADYATIFSGSVIAVLLLSYCIDRRSSYLWTTLAIIAVWLTYRLIMTAILPETAPAPPDHVIPILLHRLKEWMNTVTMFALGLSTGLLDTSLIRARFPATENWLVGFSLLNITLFIATFFTYFKRSIHRTTLVPPALMLVAVVFSLPVFIYRAWFLVDIWSLSLQRYTPTYKLAMIGMLWAIALIIKDYAVKREKPYSAAPRVAGSIVICLLIAIQAMQLYVGWGTLPVLREKHDKFALGIILAAETTENSIQLPQGIVGMAEKKQQYPEIQQYLLHNKLNVFSDNYPLGTRSRHYIESRRKFRQSNTAMLLTKPAEARPSINARWELQKGYVLVHNKEEQPLFLRVEISTPVYLPGGMSLNIDSIYLPNLRFHLFQGTQNLYFRMEPGATLEIKSAAKATVGEVELRI